MGKYYIMMLGIGSIKPIEIIGDSPIKALRNYLPDYNIARTTNVHDRDMIVHAPSGVLWYKVRDDRGDMPRLWELTDQCSLCKRRLCPDRLHNTSWLGNPIYCQCWRCDYDAL